jgi:hypothetical protein
MSEQDDYEHKGPLGLNPGLISMRWPDWCSRFWQAGREWDGKRATGVTVWNTEPDHKKITFYGISN